MPFSVLGAIVTGIASMVLGFIWYGPVLFAKTWAKEVGFTEEDLKGGSPVQYLLTFGGAIVMGAATSFLVLQLDITEPLQGVFLGLILGLGYVVTSFGSNYIFQKQKFKLYLIDAGYQVLNVVAAGLITTLIK